MLRPLIDAHSHVTAECIPQALRIMDENHIDVIIDLTPSIDNPPGSPFSREGLSAKLQAYKEHPGRFFAFCGINFEGFGTPDWLPREMDALARHIELGAIGIKLWKDLGLHLRDHTGAVIAVDDERLAPLLEYAQTQGCLIAFHISDPQAFFLPLTPENPRWETLQKRPEWWFGDRAKFPYDWWQLIRQLERVIERHRHGIIMGAHVGCASEELGYVSDVMRRNPHYIVDVSARLSEMKSHDPDDVRRFFHEHQDRVLFGIDVGIQNPADASITQRAGKNYDLYRAYYEETLALPHEIIEKFYRRNARRYILRMRCTTERERDRDRASASGFPRY